MLVSLSERGVSLSKRSLPHPPKERVGVVRKKGVETKTTYDKKTTTPKLHLLIHIF